MSEFENESLWDVIMDREKYWLGVGNDTTLSNRKSIQKIRRKVNQSWDEV